MNLSKTVKMCSISGSTFLESTQCKQKQLVSGEESSCSDTECMLMYVSYFIVSFYTYARSVYHNLNFCVNA